MGKKSLVTKWERTANIYCWLGPVLFSAGVVVLVHICLQSSPPSLFFFFPLLGVGYQGRGWVLSMNEEGRRIEYFVIVQSEGDSMYISILYICDKKKCVGFLCDTTFYLYYGSTFSVSVLIIYIWFVFLFFRFFDFVSVISCNFFPPIFVFVFVYCTVYYFCCPMRWHSYSLYSFSAVK